MDYFPVRKVQTFTRGYIHNVPGKQMTLVLKALTHEIEDLSGRWLWAKEPGREPQVIAGK